MPKQIGQPHAKTSLVKLLNLKFKNIYFLFFQIIYQFFFFSLFTITTYTFLLKYPLLTPEMPITIHPNGHKTFTPNVDRLNEITTHIHQTTNKHIENFFLQHNPPRLPDPNLNSFPKILSHVPTFHFEKVINSPPTANSRTPIRTNPTSK